MRGEVIRVLLLILLLCLPGVFALDVDLNDLTIRNPKISLNFTDPVRLEGLNTITKLTNAEGTRAYPLCARPVSTVFERTHELYTTTATDPECTAGVRQYLTPGDYLLTVQGIDAKGNRTPLYPIPFRVSGLEIKLHTPASNVSPIHPSRIVFETTRLQTVTLNQQAQAQPVNAVCRYALSLSKSWDATTFNDLSSSVGAENSMHSLSIALPVNPGNLYIICKESVGAGQEAKLHIPLRYDLTAPRFTAVTQNPAIITTLTGMKGITRIKATTDDRAACNITGEGIALRFFEEQLDQYHTYVTNHDVDLEYDPQEVGLTARNFSYTISCTNLAGHRNTTQVNVTVDFSSAMSIQVITPPSIINKTSFELLIQPVVLADPAKQVSGCTVNGEPMTRRQSRFASQFAFSADGSEDGRKLFAIECTDEKVTSLEHEVTVDSRAPTAPMINASQFICSNNITARFTSTDQGTGVVLYNYTASDEQGIIATGTTRDVANVRLQRPIRGPVLWQAFAVDGAENKGASNSTTVAEVTTGQDEECGLPPFIQLRSPGMGLATEVPYTIEITTSRPSMCRYSLLANTQWAGMTPFNPTGGVLHTAANMRFTQQTLYVACNETERLHTKQFTIGVDASEPRIVSVSGAPNPVLDRTNKVVTLTIRTDDRTHCSIDGESISGDDDNQANYKTLHTTTLDYRHITNPERQDFSYNIVCKNLALLEASAPYSTFVHLGADFTIEVLSPQSFTASTEIALRIRPSKEAICLWNGSQQFTTANGTHVALLGNLAEGSYTIPITCTAAAEEGSTIAQFTVDRSRPTLALNGSSYFCEDESPKLYFNVTSADEDPTISYVLTATNFSRQESTTDDLIVLEELAPATYTLSANVTNRANLTSAPASLQFEVLNATSAICSLPADHCTNKVKDVTEDGIDCGGSCPACTKCIDDLQCGPGEYCNSGVCEETTIECTTDDVCGTGICQEGKCVAGPSIPPGPTGCVSDDECGDGICEYGVCRAGPVGPGPSGPTTQCSIDDDCNLGELCIAGYCEAPAETESNLLSTVLIALGIAIMGGAGYVLYQQNMEKSNTSSSNSFNTPARPLSPPIAAQYEENKEQRQAALAAAIAKREAERQKRASTFQSFGEQKQMKQDTDSEQKQVSKKDKDDDDYVELGAIKKGKKKDEEDAFDKLEKL